MTDEVVKYTDPLPITKEWAKEHEGDTISVRYVMDLDGLIEVDGIEGMNDYLDAVTNVILSDISYRIVTPEAGENGAMLATRGTVDDIARLLGPDSVLIEATGTLESY